MQMLHMSAAVSNKIFTMYLRLLFMVHLYYLDQRLKIRKKQKDLQKLVVELL